MHSTVRLPVKQRRTHGDWFEGDIKDLKPKPILQALKNAFSPFGVSVELWIGILFRMRVVRFACLYSTIRSNREAARSHAAS